MIHAMFPNPDGAPGVFVLCRAADPADLEMCDPVLFMRRYIDEPDSVDDTCGSLCRECLCRLNSLLLVVCHFGPAQLHTVNNE